VVDVTYNRRVVAIYYESVNCNPDTSLCCGFVIIIIIIISIIIIIKGIYIAQVRKGYKCAMLLCDVLRQLCVRGPIYKISYDLSYDYRKFIVRSAYDSDLKRAEISLKNIVS